MRAANVWVASLVLLGGSAWARPTAAELSAHVEALREKAPREEFAIVVEPPFVVIGDEAPDVVRRRAVGTVRWAASKLKAEYGFQDPAGILDVWLFRDTASYRRNARRLFGTEPHTPYGYYSSEHRALVMNISTGGGTLVHELVHSFVEANFPRAPSWLNEGLGSLYEQSAERDGRIVGLTNWRLEGLKRAIRAGRVPTFHALTHTSSHEFYEEDPGTNYAQARYLLYYLQEVELLRAFYARFAATHAEDPTGYQALRAVLGAKDMKRFQRDWEKYVLSLAFAG